MWPEHFVEQWSRKEIEKKKKKGRWLLWHWAVSAQCTAQPTIAPVVLLGQLSLPESIWPASIAVSTIARSPVAAKTPPVLSLAPGNPRAHPFLPRRLSLSIPFLPRKLAVARRRLRALAASRASPTGRRAPP